MVGDWYAIQAKPHSERLVLRRLTSKHIPVLLPLIEIIRRRRTRRVRRLEPAFPSYLFVRLGELEQDRVRPGEPFVRGARVRIRRGPLSGLQGVFDRPVSRAGRARVLLELLGQTRRLEVDILDLEAD